MKTLKLEDYELDMLYNIISNELEELYSPNTFTNNATENAIYWYKPSIMKIKEKIEEAMPWRKGKEEDIEEEDLPFN